MLIPDTDRSSKGRDLVEPGALVSDEGLADLLIDKLRIGMKHHADMRTGLIRRRRQVEVIDAWPDGASLLDLVDLPLSGVLRLQKLLSIHHKKALLHHQAPMNCYLYKWQGTVARQQAPVPPTVRTIGS
jgi:hypothetical protein